MASALELSEALPITNRRYGRLQICATKPRCAVNTYAREREHSAKRIQVPDSVIFFCVWIFIFFSPLDSLSVRKEANLCETRKPFRADQSMGHNGKRAS